MRFAVDATPWFNERGYGRYTREILSAAVARGTQHEFVFFVDQRDRSNIDLEASNLEVRGVELAERPTEAASKDSNRSPWDMMKMTRAVSAAKPFDAVFYPTVYTYFPRPRGVPSLVTIHDAIIERNPEVCIPSKKARMFWNLKVRTAIRQSAALLTVSDFARDDIRKYLDTKGRDIFVSGEAPSAAYSPNAPSDAIRGVRERLSLADGTRYFVYVGGFNPHKNLELLIRSHSRVVREVENPPVLVLVGTRSRDVFHTGTKAIENEIAGWGTEEMVRWADFTPDEELRALHCDSLGLTLPSQAEGFGLPAIEAAACGSPVIATDVSPLPQLLEGGGIFLDPGDEQGWTAALEKLSTDEDTRAAMGRQAQAAASKLTWELAADNLLQALEHIGK